MIEKIKTESGIQVIMDKLENISTCSVGVFVKTGSSDEKEKEGIVKKIAEGMQKLQKGTAVTTNISWESVLILGNGSAYYGDAQNEEFYPILDRLLGENFEEIEEKIEEEINDK